VKNKRQRNRFLNTLGPGLITGAADDDPSGIATYSMAGATLGYATLWTALLTLPLMAVVQFICAKIGMVSGMGLAGVLRENYSRKLLYPAVVALVVANTINTGTDIGAIAAALNMFVPIPITWMIAPVALVIVVLQFWGSYHLIVRVFKWLTLALFAYVGAAFLAKPNWSAVIKATIIPQFSLNGKYLVTLVAILGTTISPYLFFWQASQEAEDQRVDRTKRPLIEKHYGARREFSRIRADTVVGMAFSNLIALSIIVTAAATLHAAGKTDIQTSAQAAEALRPIAGQFAEVIFALGIVGTGLLAIPVLGGATAYAVGEGRRWPVGLARRPKEAAAFYAVLALSGAIGIALNFASINPISALYWSAVVNGVLAVPVMVLLMFMARRRDVMDRYVIGGPLYWLGWLSTAAMFFSVLAMGIGMTVGMS